MSIQRHPLQFPIERINDLNKHAYMATAYSFVSEDGSEYVLAGPNPMAAYQKAVEVYGEHARMDLAQQVVLMNKVTYQLLLERAGLVAEPWKPNEESKPVFPRLQPIKKVGRRRRQIFEASEGKCHYCACELELEGKWHVEHKMPRALGGGDEPTNLVAACIPCNMKKRDSTDVEFRARLAAEEPNT